MTDLEMTKLCAEAMGLSGHPVKDGMEMWTDKGWEDHKDALVLHHSQWQYWNPLHDDAQAMALEDWLIEHGTLEYKGRRWMQFLPHGNLTAYLYFEFSDKNERRRRIVECVAKVHQHRSE